MNIDVGDVLAVNTGNNWAARLIRAGEALRGLPCMDNHIVVAHHKANGVWYGIEGRPGGVGWTNIGRYLKQKQTTSNNEQPRTDDQRKDIAATMKQLLGTPYGFNSILRDALVDVGLDLLWRPRTESNGIPGHVICSTVAAYVYKKLGLPHPNAGHEAESQPGDWTKWNWSEGWKAHV